MAKSADQEPLSVQDGKLEGQRASAEAKMAAHAALAQPEGSMADAPNGQLRAIPLDDMSPVAEGRPDDSATRLSEETLLPFTGMVRLSPRELEIIDHPAFQRLFAIYQLGQTHLVYRGATHMRGEHAIGTLEMATRLAKATRRNATEEKVEPSEHWQRSEPLSTDELAFVRLGALLHDLGHLPAGHTLEDELGLFEPHDADERINMILYLERWGGQEYRSLGEWVDDRYGVEAQRAGQLDEAGEQLSASELLVRLISRDRRKVVPAPGSSFRLSVCRDLIGNTICADLLDYLHRDWLHLGKPREFDPRLLEYLEILTRVTDAGREDRLAINLRGGPRPRPDAVTAVLDLLESRYQLQEIALFHRVKLTASGMLERVIAEYRDTFPVPDQADALAALVPQLLECSDLEMLALFESALRGRRAANGDPRRIEGAMELARRLRVRELHRDLLILYEDEVGGPAGARLIVERFRGNPDLDGAARRDNLQKAAANRLLALRTLEEDFGLNPGDIVMYCPSQEMNTKLAKVGVHFNGVVDSLAQLDAHNGNLTGGHLDAQQRRFRRLWRVSFAIDAGARERLRANGTLDCLRRMIVDAVLRRPIWGQPSAEVVVRAIAEDMTKLEHSPYHRGSVREPAMNRGESSVSYPGGAPSIRSFIKERTKRTQSARRGSATTSDA